MGESITVTGDKELARAMDGIGHDLGDLQTGASGAAALIQREARSRAPVRTGRLRGSITPGAGKGGVATVGTPISYGWPVHQGVPSRHMAPNPFLSAALAAVESRVIEGYARNVDTIVDSEVRSKAK